jgi:RNA polymerase sigma-70 factor (ECF subfamily)
MLTHLGSLLAVATRLTRSGPEAEDLVQDTLVKAIRAREQYTAGTNLKAWLLTILKNTFINRYRRGGLERSVLEGPDADPMADGWIGAATMRGMRDPEAQVLRPVLEREIIRALDTIPEDFRLIVLLSDVEELSYREIADLVGCPIGTVMSRLHRGRRLLKKQLLEQARNLGIVDDAEVDSHPARSHAEPVALDAYRAKKGAAR